MTDTLPASPLTHRYPVRVFYEDTDAAGIVYHARYLHFTERARTMLLADLGIGQRDLAAKHGIVFAVRRQTITYQRPALLDDGLLVETDLTGLTGARLHFDQRVCRNDQPVCEQSTELAVLRPDGRPTRLPNQLRQLFAQWCRPADRGRRHA